MNMPSNEIKAGPRWNDAAVDEDDSGGAGTAVTSRSSKDWARNGERSSA